MRYLRVGKHSPDIRHRRVSVRWFALCVVLAATLPGFAEAASASVRWTEIRSELVANVNRDLKPDVPTADVGIYYPSNFDAGFAEKLSVDELVLQFVVAKGVFRTAGVQLKLLWIKSGQVDPTYLEIQSNDMAGKTPGSQYVNMYENNLRETSVLSAEARKAFDSIIEPHTRNARTVYLVVLQDVFMSFFEKLDERTWETRTITTGGLSFPTYSYKDLPPRIRGVITVNKSDPLRRIVAHELGHKLMNVSHEYNEMSPQHEIRGDGGLMLYGKGTEIPSGEAGRWHLERLQRSPFLYRETAAGKRTWNPDYREGGHYYDPIYGPYVIRFGVAAPAP
jgi:hypothetical protein